MFDLGIPVSERIVSILQPGDVWLWMVVEISPIMCVYIYEIYDQQLGIYGVCVCVNYWVSIDWFLRENLQETMFSYLQILRFPAGFPLNVPDI